MYNIKTNIFGGYVSIAGNATTATLAASATALATGRTLFGSTAFDGTANITDIIASTYGGTGNGFTKFSGPTTSEKTFTLPDASSTLAVQSRATWTPVLTCATPGDLAVTYSTQLGWYDIVGNRLHAEFMIITSGFTWTTASGSLRITGLPQASANINANVNSMGSVAFRGVTKSGYTQILPCVTNNVSLITFLASGTAVGEATCTISDCPTAGSVRFYGSVCYPI